MSTEAAAVCREAAHIIAQRGKATHTYQDDQNRVCMFGALALASGGVAYDQMVVPDGVVGAVYGHFRRMGNSTPVGWNDDDETTAEDVAKLLLQVADDLEVSS